MIEVSESASKALDSGLYHFHLARLASLLSAVVQQSNDTSMHISFPPSSPTRLSLDSLVSSNFSLHWYHRPQSRRAGSLSHISPRSFHKLSTFFLLLLPSFTSALDGIFSFSSFFSSFFSSLLVKVLPSLVWHSSTAMNNTNDVNIYSSL
jgi:hypothetical protein